MIIKYDSPNIKQSFKRYEMLYNSLRITKDQNDIKGLCAELNRIEETILEDTNDIYEREYMKAISSESTYMADERDKVAHLVTLIEERMQYVETHRNQNKDITGLIADAPKVLGEDGLDKLKEKLAIIDKYEKNLKLIDLLTKEIRTLDERIQTALAKIQSNTKLNDKLEAQMIKLMSESFQKLDLYSLPENSKEINLAYSELEFSLSKASDNLMKAKKTTNKAIIQECEAMLKTASENYNHYKEKKIILKLLEIYDIKCSGYEELLHKREEINTNLRAITGSELYKLVYDELNSQYNTIKIEGQDIKTYTSLTEDKAKKTKLLNEIESENNSEEFTTVIKKLIENEKRRKAKEEEERRRRETEIQQYRLLEEQKKKAEMLKRQKEIEEKRKKEIEERTKKLLEEKQKPTVVADDEEVRSSDNLSFQETIKPFKDTPSLENMEDEVPSRLQKSKVQKLPEEDFSFFGKMVDDVHDESKEDTIILDDVADFFPTSTSDDNKTEDEPKSKHSRLSSIPIIKNHKLTPRKVKEEVVKNEEPEKSKKSTDLEDFSIEDIIFPDMP